MQDLPQIEIETVAGGLQFVDGLAWSRSGFLVAADVRQSKLYRIDSTPKPKVLVEKSGGASGVAYDIQGRLYICESAARRLSRMDAKGSVEEFAAGFEGKKFNAPNDVTVRRDGHVYFTDPGFGSAADRRDFDFHGVWHVSPKGDVEPVAKWQTRPNGIALSADGKLLFVTDSDRHAVVAFDAGKNGEISGQRDVVKNIAGVPGGIKTDVGGRLYVAAKGLAVYTAGGKLERTLMENTNLINCAFGESDSGHLFLSSRDKILRARLGVKGAFQY